MSGLTLNQGRFLVKYARAVIESHFGAETPDIPKEMLCLMEERQRVFVLLKGYPHNGIRGYTGYAESAMPLNRVIAEVALSAALRSPKFPPVRQSELGHLIVEVSLLTEPRHVRVDDPLEYPENIEVGMDGLIIHKGFFKGLLLPQFPVERGWNSKEFLSKTCIRGGFDPDSWSKDDIILHKFNAQIFRELEPRGDIVERDLSRKLNY